jgi:hypothetical protein
MTIVVGRCCCLHTVFLLWALLLLSLESNDYFHLFAVAEQVADDNIAETKDENVMVTAIIAAVEEGVQPDTATDFDDRTVLDMFGDLAKEYLTQKIIPETDTECKWDWRVVRCEPVCTCDFQPRLGDYHLGRSCRKRASVADSCDASRIPTANNLLQLVIQNVVRTSQKALYSASKKTKTGYHSLQTKVCMGLTERTCNSSSSGNDDKEDILLAWQERLLCKNIIPECPHQREIPPEVFNEQQSEH